MVRHGGLEQVDFLTHAAIKAEDLARSLVGDTAPGTRVTTASIMAQGVAAEAGALLRGGPRLEDLAWQRRRTVGDREPIV